MSSRPAYLDSIQRKMRMGEDLLRGLEERLGDLERTPSYMPLDPEDERLCILAGEVRQEVSRMVAELSHLLDNPDAELPEPPSPPADA